MNFQPCLSFWGLTLKACVRCVILQTVDINFSSNLIIIKLNIDSLDSRKNLFEMNSVSCFFIEIYFVNSKSELSNTYSFSFIVLSKYWIFCALAVKGLDYAFSLKVRAREEEQHEAAAIHLHHRESHSYKLFLISKPRFSDERLCTYKSVRILRC